MNATNIFIEVNNNLTPVIPLNNTSVCSCRFPVADNLFLIILGVIIYFYLIAEVYNAIQERKKGVKINISLGIFSFSVILFFCFFRTVTPELWINFIAILGLMLLRKFV